VAVREPSTSGAGHAGFSLIEVVVATSLLLLTVVCVTPLFVDSQGAASRASRADDARRLAQSTLERLRGLPFVPPSPSPGYGDGADTSVVGSLFPHADVARNEPDNFVVLGTITGWPLGTFVTRRHVGAFAVTTESRFGGAGPCGLTPVSVSALDGYGPQTPDRLPSGILLVTVRVSWPDRGGERTVARPDVLQDESVGVTE
jgi:hypothetical protein